MPEPRGPRRPTEQPFRKEGAGQRLTGMQWIEAIINISALAGFVGVANLGRKKPDLLSPD